MNSQIGTIFLATIAAAAMTVIPGWAHGRFTNRWGPPADLQAAADRMDRLPHRVGAWVYLEDGESLTPDARAELGVAHFVNRIYQNSVTGRTVPS